MAIAIDQKYERLFMMAALCWGGGATWCSEDGGCAWPSCALTTEISSSPTNRTLRTAEGRAAILYYGRRNKKNTAKRRF
uniref:Uncharacterized protein n=1 Tax=Cucumis melo TaxID=3656 RepID=A0A9I9DWA1_CUCME